MKKVISVFMAAICLILSHTARGQNQVFINLARLDGVDITPDNFLNYQVQSSLSRNTRVMIRGTIRYRQSDLSISYEFPYTLQPGLNLISGSIASPRPRYSSTALKELFEIHRKLPEGIYEYCVSVELDYQNPEAGPPVVIDECIYHKSEDIFLINLVDPPDDALIYEYNPMLSWTVNYPFAGELSYRLRLAEIKEGQNNVAAINRNNPVFSQKDLRQLSLMYPLYAKPLVKDQPYAWTVDAYYKGILIGGAQPWRFTIVEDSFVTGIPRDPSYVDIKKESGGYTLYAPGKIKLKYVLEDLKTDTLQLQLLDKNDKVMKLPKDFKNLSAVLGDNRFELDFKESQPLRHLGKYTLLIQSLTGQSYRILFTYINPDFIK